MTVAKPGNSYFATRENETGLYQLDSSSVDALEKSADEIKPGCSTRQMNGCTRVVACPNA